jgi:hypothetical protein
LQELALNISYDTVQSQQKVGDELRAPFSPRAHLISRLQAALKAWLDSESDYRLTEEKAKVHISIDERKLSSILA